MAAGLLTEDRAMSDDCDNFDRRARRAGLAGAAAAAAAGDRRSGAAARQGFTLLEMLLVLGLVVALAALAWPALRGPLSQTRLREGARSLRVALAQARLEAMQAGTVCHLRYQPGAGAYELEVLSADDVLEPGTWAADQRPAAPAMPPAVAAAAPTIDGRSDEPGAAMRRRFVLPEGVVFAAPGDDARGPSTLAADTSHPDAWAPPIRFFPDGTASPARFVLRDAAGAQVVVSLRGLTGITRTSEIVTIEELR